MAPWRTPRHRSWASDTNVTTFFAVVVVIVYIVWELVGEAPQGVVTLVGLAGGALFGAVSGDKSKRSRETERTAERAVETAERAETKADRLTEPTKPADDEEHQGDKDRGTP